MLNGISHVKISRSLNKGFSYHHSLVNSIYQVFMLVEMKRFFSDYLFFANSKSILEFV